MKSNYILGAVLCVILAVMLLATMCGIRAIGAELPEVKFFTDADVEMLAKTVWGEVRGCSDVQKEAVVWCILNRVDDDRFPESIVSVITAPNEFFGYDETNPVDDDIRELVRKVLLVWATEEMMPADGMERVLPREYVFFSGNGYENVFTTAYKAGSIWDLSKYESEAAGELPQVYGVC